MAYTTTRPTRTTTVKPAFAQAINKPATASPTTRNTAQKPKTSGSTAMTSRVTKKSSTGTTTMPGFSATKLITPFQRRVYVLLLQIPAGRISTYAALSKALDSSPRAVGGALRDNPFAPEVPCHRVIASTGFVGGFMGDWEKAPSGVNQNKKLALLKGEGVGFDTKGMLVDRRCWWDDFAV